MYRIALLPITIAVGPGAEARDPPIRTSSAYWQATPFTANELGEALDVLFQEPLNPIPE